MSARAVPPGRHGQRAFPEPTYELRAGKLWLRAAAEAFASHVRGVIGVKNAVEVIPPVTPDRVAEQIEEAFKREAGVDARHVTVEVADHAAKLYGPVHSIDEASAAVAPAAAAPGVAKVENHLVISP